jgi:hypothetical protein
MHFQFLEPLGRDCRHLASGGTRGCDTRTEFSKRFWYKRRPYPLLCCNVVDGFTTKYEGISRLEHRTREGSNGYLKLAGENSE